MLGGITSVLGKKDDIVPILKGQRPVPDDMHPKRRFLLQQIPEANEHGGVEANAGATSLQRGSHVRALGHRQRNLRRLKAREGFSLRQAHHQVRVYLADQVLGWLKEQPGR